MNHEITTPISGLNRIYQIDGTIVLPWSDAIFFKMAKIAFERFEDESFQYVFEPYYDVIDGLGPDVTIPGIDLSFRQERYYRVNHVPTFISERTFPKHRVDARNLMSERGQNHYDALAWLIDSPYVYNGDPYLVKSDAFFDSQIAIEDSHNIYRHIIHALQALGARKSQVIGGIEVTDSNRGLIIRIYLAEYRLVEKHYYQKLKQNKGRKKQPVSLVELGEVVHLMEHRVIDAKEAMRRLQIGSRSTLYRRIREFEATTNNALRNDSIR